MLVTPTDCTVTPVSTGAATVVVHASNKLPTAGRHEPVSPNFIRCTRQLILPPGVSSVKNSSLTADRLLGLSEVDVVDIFRVARSRDRYGPLQLSQR